MPSSPPAPQSKPETPRVSSEVREPTAELQRGGGGEVPGEVLGEVRHFEGGEVKLSPFIT